MRQAQELGLVVCCVDTLILEALEDPRMLGEPLMKNVEDDDSDFEKETVVRPLQTETKDLLMHGNGYASQEKYDLRRDLQSGGRVPGEVQAFDGVGEGGSVREGAGLQQAVWGGAATCGAEREAAAARGGGSDVRVAVEAGGCDSEGSGG